MYTVGHDAEGTSQSGSTFTMLEYLIIQSDVVAEAGTGRDRVQRADTVMSADAN